MGLIGTVVVIVVALLWATIKILNEYERGVVLTLGRYTSTKGPASCCCCRSSSRCCGSTCARS
jgi:regulator of protease activity HflC (stomatin/prohibitin superfamily)